MAFLYLTRTVHMPTTADGCTIKNGFGVVIATAVDPMTASAMADLINLGRSAAEDNERRHDANQAYRTGMLMRTRRPERCSLCGALEGEECRVGMNCSNADR